MRNPAEWSLVPDNLTFIPIQSPALEKQKDMGQSNAYAGIININRV